MEERLAATAISGGNKTPRKLAGGVESTKPVGLRLPQGFREAKLYLGQMEDKTHKS